MVTLVPHLGCRQHAHDLFLTHLQRAPEGVMRRTVNPGGLAEIFPPKQQAGALGPTNSFPAAVGNQVSTPPQMNFRGQIFRGSVDKHRDSLAPGHFSDRLQTKRPRVIRTGQYVHHGGLRTECCFEFLHVVDCNQLHPHHADRMIVNVARVAGYDDLVFQAIQVG